jgi:hypothetical protein
LNYKKSGNFTFIGGPCPCLRPCSTHMWPPSLLIHLTPIDDWPMLLVSHLGRERGASILPDRRLQAVLVVWRNRCMSWGGGGMEMTMDVIGVTWSCASFRASRSWQWGHVIPTRHYQSHHHSRPVHDQHHCCRHRSTLWLCHPQPTPPQLWITNVSLVCALSRRYRSLPFVVHNHAHSHHHRRALRQTLSDLAYCLQAVMCYKV